MAIDGLDSFTIHPAEGGFALLAARSSSARLSLLKLLFKHMRDEQTASTALQRTVPPRPPSVRLRNLVG